MKVFHIESLKKEYVRFNEIVAEGSFLVRTLFFLLFGFLIQTEDLLNTQSLPWSLGIVAGIFIIRYVFMRIMRITEMTILYIAPRGLITILLFLSIAQNDQISIINTPLIIQVIILTALVMMFGLLKTRKPAVAEIKPETADIALSEQIEPDNEQ
ncbi:hypothetical protein SDC9_75150 [bioreactor metagenome]|uniref:Uncharacterized protein n=1 Tax=bioreactor metagenome TaxID=1076179 RepID=A0A644YR99_9ZZZZ